MYIREKRIIDAPKGTARGSRWQKVAGNANANVTSSGFGTVKACPHLHHSFTVPSIDAEQMSWTGISRSNLSL